MVAMLVFGLVVVLARSDDVIFQLTHGLKFHATSHFAEGVASLMEGVFGSHLEGFAVLCVVIAKDVEGGNLSEWVEKSSAETRDDVEVAVACFDVWEKAAAVNALT